MNYVILYKLASATVRPIDESGLNELRNTCQEIVSQDPVLSIPMSLLIMDPLLAKKMSQIWEYSISGGFDQKLFARVQFQGGIFQH